MKLGQWLKKEGLTHDDFVIYMRQSGSDVIKGAIDKWCNGQRIPRKNDMQTITDLTNQEVTPNDFYEIENNHQ